MSPLSAQESWRDLFSESASCVFFFLFVSFSGSTQYEKADEDDHLRYTIYNVQVE